MKTCAKNKISCFFPVFWGGLNYVVMQIFFLFAAASVSSFSWFNTLDVSMYKTTVTNAVNTLLKSAEGGKTSELLEIKCQTSFPVYIKRHQHFFNVWILKVQETDVCCGQSCTCTRKCRNCCWGRRVEFLTWRGVVSKPVFHKSTPFECGAEIKQRIFSVRPTS